MNEKAVSFSENEGTTAKKYIVTLSVEERKNLSALIGSGTEKARKLTHARILLKADEGWQDREICKALDVSIPTVERVRMRHVFEGCEAVLKLHQPNRTYSRKLDGEQEARVIALVCSSPPVVLATWSSALVYWEKLYHFQTHEKEEMLV